MGRRIIVAVLGLVITLLILPVLINQLMRIDWFSGIVVGDEEIWLSFYGSYIGGIIGGLLTLVGVIITIDFQKKTIKKTNKEALEKNIKVIDSLVDATIANLLYFITIDSVEDYELKEQDIKMMKISLNRLELNKNEMNKLPWEIIPHRYFEEFIHIRELVNILEEEIRNVLEDETNNHTETKKKLKEAIINRRVRIILEHYIKFTSNKELMKGLLKDI
ncbi:hypothetical protein [Virgibacillus halodenitrificans]|uniref:hypothetical protein n=1 Tax=Virgibacillus halodenitrificans TaxID=1482 RepID=UPI000EF55BD6|nr:hypothetical protein [Virgibacillus halodenitrificans]